MSKKILILNGSPRAKGNTKALIEAFEKARPGTMWSALTCKP